MLVTRQLPAHLFLQSWEMQYPLRRHTFTGLTIRRHGWKINMMQVSICLFEFTLTCVYDIVYINVCVGFVSCSVHSFTLDVGMSVVVFQIIIYKPEDSLLIATKNCIEFTLS